MRLSIGTVLLVALWFQPARAGGPELRYARSNGDWQHRSSPGKYSALNVLDGDPKTVWCTAGSGQNAFLEVLFSERVTIEKMEVATGNQHSVQEFGDFNRVRELLLSEGDMMHTVNLSDRSGLQTLEFDPSLSTQRLVLRLKAAHRGKGKHHTCLSDVIFYRNNKPLNGSALRKTIAASRKSLDFLDTWVSGPEYGRDRELVLGLGGQFSFVHEPADPAEPAVNKDGTWVVSGPGLALKVGRKEVYAVRIKRDDAGRVLKLSIDENENTDMNGTYVRRSGGVQE